MIEPTIPELGTVYLTPDDDPALRMTTDPTTARKWESRKSVTPVIGGAVTQDFGKLAVDCTLELTWDGKTQVLDKVVVKKILDWTTGAPGRTLRYEDGEGNDFTVEVVKFLPDRVFGQPSLYGAQLTLHVLAMSKLLGEDYTGS